MVGGADSCEFIEMGGPEMAPHPGNQPVTTSGGQPSSAGQPSRGQQSSGQPSAGQTDRDVVVVTELPAAVDEAALAGRERDTLVLTADERRWGRRRVTTTAGRTLALALPTGSVLRPGAVLHVAAEWFVVVECAAEACLAVTPASREEALRIAFEVGNRHFNLALDGERLLVPDDPGMDILLTRMNVRFERVRAPFVPIGRAQRHDR